MANKKAIKELAKFIKDSVKTLTTSDYTCCRKIIAGDSELAIYVGWGGGYDENDESLYLSGTYAINVGVMIRNDSDWTDLEYLNMPVYSEGEADVYDTLISLNKSDAKDGFVKVAEDVINTYLNVRKGLDDGTLKII